MTVTCNDSTRALSYSLITLTWSHFWDTGYVYFSKVPTQHTVTMSRRRAKSLPRDGEAHQQCARCVIPLVGHVHVPVHVETDREESLSAIRIRNPHHPPGHGSLPFNFYCCPNSTSSIDLTASSACFTIIKNSSCPENWQGDHPSGLRLHYAYALTPKMESTTSPPSPTTRHFDLHTLPFSARTAPSPGGDHLQYHALGRFSLSTSSSSAPASV